MAKVKKVESYSHLESATSFGLPPVSGGVLSRVMYLRESSVKGGQPYCALSMKVVAFTYLASCSSKGLRNSTISKTSSRIALVIVSCRPASWKRDKSQPIAVNISFRVSFFPENRRPTSHAYLRNPVSGKIDNLLHAAQKNVVTQV